MYDGLLYAGDADFHRNELNPADQSWPAMLDALQSGAELDRQQRLESLHRLRASGLRIFSAHDPVEFEHSATI